MKQIRIRTIPHDQQRYPTVGDYQEKPGIIEIAISDMANWQYEAMVAVHELVEKILVNARKIPEASIDAFDMEFEKNRKPGDLSEPGDNVNAPYFNEHAFATHVERQLCGELELDWDEYSRVVANL